MLIEIANLGEEPITVEGKVAAEELGFRHENAELKEDVEFRAVIRLLEEGGALQCQGECATVLEFFCCRCLEPMRQEQHLAFCLVYTPNPKCDEHSREIELKYEDMDLGFYDGVVFNTGDMLNEQLLLSIPLKSLCREDCRGLCPLCGRNRNVESCDCKVGSTNPFQEKLLSLQKSLGKGRPQ